MTEGQLIQLADYAGCKTIIKNYPGNIALTPFGLGSFDIDTNADYQRLINSNN